MASLEKRSWHELNRYAFKSFKHTLGAIILVPLFFFFLNPNMSGPGYWSDMRDSTRIGVQIGVFCFIFMTVFYAWIFRYKPERLIPLKTSVPFQTALGLLSMSIGLGLTSIFEPSI